MKAQPHVEHRSRVTVSAKEPKATAPAVVEAWRLFGLQDDGILIGPFGKAYWPDADVKLREWRPGEQAAMCLVSDHPAPADDCTCGIRGVEDRDALLNAARSCVLAGATRTLLADTGVLGKVALAGRVLPGVNIPDDDPPTTWRAERATLLELHLGPAHTAVSTRAAATYSNYFGDTAPVPVLLYDKAGWSDLVGPEGSPTTGHVAARVRPPLGQAAQTSEESFIAEVRKTGFGRSNLSDPDDMAALVAVGKSMCKAMRGGVGLNDVLSVLFDSGAAPRWNQAQAFVDAVINNLCPDCAFRQGFDGYQYARPIPLGEDLKRGLGWAG